MDETLFKCAFFEIMKAENRKQNLRKSTRIYPNLDDKLQNVDIQLDINLRQLFNSGNNSQQKQLTESFMY